MIQQGRVNSPIGFLPANVIKIIACISMFFDHFGLMVYPSEFGYRMIGRLAFPIFAFFISEGCHYSKRKVRRFLLVFVCGIIYLFFYYIMGGGWYANIFLTFSASILIIYAMDYAKKAAFSDWKIHKRICAFFIFAASVIGFYLFSRVFEFDYGFIGIMTPVLVSLFDFGSLNVPKWLKVLDAYYVRIVMLTVAVSIYVFTSRPIYVDIFSFKVSLYAACFIPPILLIFYNGKVGKYKMKYFFYIFYPAHLVIVYAIDMIMSMVNK